MFVYINYFELQNNNKILFLYKSLKCLIFIFDLNFVLQIKYMKTTTMAFDQFLNCFS